MTKQTQETKPPPSKADLIKAIITKTGDPLMPLRLLETYNSMIRLTESLIKDCELKKSQEILTKLMSVYTDEEFNKLSVDPNYIHALMVMLKCSLIEYANDAYRNS